MVKIFIEPIMRQVILKSIVWSYVKTILKLQKSIENFLKLKRLRFYLIKARLFKELEIYINEFYMKRKLSKDNKSLVKRLEYLAYNINMKTVDTFVQHYHRRCMLKKLETYLKEKAKAEDVVQYEINEL